ncbi:nose resistant to fluoxetine protein 6 [Dermacentor silvarum]|uniref:nose resistant to fluoxetine protein 6 n=1 Tax=Dermacentor silvarum TaxID=543639 RepID=UPI002100E6D0|nr:nose resistant to fluoxetine protein 6 [Dermacentor silvarum]
MMLHVAKDKKSEAYRLRFLHGIRFFSIVWVTAIHSYAANSHVWSSMTNWVKYADEWQNMIATAGFISVDSFFFLSGFLLAAVVCKETRTGIIIFLFAVIRRLIRTMVPVFFFLMCLYLLPLITSGPNAKTYFQSVHKDFRSQWLVLLLQVQNYYFDINADTRMFPHLWYLSVDFQFFLLSLLILLLLKNRPKIAVAIFALLSLVGCTIATWQVAVNDMTPFVVGVTESPSRLFRTGYRYYFYPFYHAVCYFSGCITFFLVAWFRERKIPKMFQIAAWLLAVASGLCCIFMKTAWYRTDNPTTEFGNLSTAFFDRILWSICLIWITLACATGRGGFLCKFLSWSAFTPLSRLAFGVYIVHFPFAHLTMHISRERMFYSHFFICCYFLRRSCFALERKLDYALSLKVIHRVTMTLSRWSGSHEREQRAVEREPPERKCGRYEHCDSARPVSFFFYVLVWSFLISYFMFIFCEAPTGRLDKLMFEGRRATKEKDPKDEVPNANGLSVVTVPLTRGSPSVSTTTTDIPT